MAFGITPTDVSILRHSYVCIFSAPCRVGLLFAACGFGYNASISVLSFIKVFLASIGLSENGPGDIESASSKRAMSVEVCS